MRDFLDFLGFMIVVVSLPVIVCGAILLCGNYHTAYQCKSYQEITQKETKYANFDSCYIKTTAGWQRWDEYKARAIASEGLKD